MIQCSIEKDGWTVSVAGDYDDLYTLHEAMSELLDFFAPEEEDENLLLSLNYDIRKAYSGDRFLFRKEAGFDEQTQNLYASVPIPLGWFVWLLTKWNNVLAKPHDYYNVQNTLQLIYDNALLDVFLFSGWKCLAQWMDSDWAEELVCCASRNILPCLPYVLYAQTADRILHSLPTPALRHAWMSLYLFEWMGKKIAVPADSPINRQRIRSHLKEEKEKLANACTPFMTLAVFNKKLRSFLYENPDASLDDIEGWMDENWGILPEHELYETLEEGLH